MAIARNDPAARKFVVDNYGWFSYFLDDGELGPILLEAGAVQESPTAVMAKIQNTNWWRARSETQRAWETMKVTDPATATQRQQQQHAIVSNLLEGWGFGGRLPVDQIVEFSLAQGWNEAQTARFLASNLTMAETAAPGQAADTFQKIKATAADYYIGMTEQTALDLTRKVMTGQMSPEHLGGYFQQQAKSKFAYLSDVIDKGITVKEYFDPHKQELARSLEMAPEQIDLMNDPRFLAVTRTVGEDGKERAMTIAETQQYARNRKEWTTTANARQEVAGLTDALGKIFGRR